MDRIGAVRSSLDLEDAEVDFDVQELPTDTSGICRLSFRFESLMLRIAAVQWAASSKSDPEAADPHLDNLARIVASGFLNEYLWTHSRSPAWIWSPDPARLNAFRRWNAEASIGNLPPIPIEISHPRCADAEV